MPQRTETAEATRLTATQPQFSSKTAKMWSLVHIGLQISLSLKPAKAVS
jgi:hypothetical protein